MKLLNKKEIEHFVKQQNLFPKNSVLKITDILSELDESEGLVNQIYKIEDNNKSVIIKQVLPFALAIKKEIGEEHPMDPSRINLEARALSFLNTFWSGISPEVYKLDLGNGLIIMEDLTRLNNLRFELPKAKMYSSFGIEMGTLLAGLRYYTSDLYLDSKEQERFHDYFDNALHRNNMTNMILGPESPLFRDENFEPVVWPVREKAAQDPIILKDLERMRAYLINSLECFSHMDLHIGNILIDSEDIKIIDSEFSGMGTSFMDLGRLSSSFLINYFAWLFMDAPEKNDMLVYDTQMIFDLFESYRITLKRLIPESYEKVYRDVLLDSIRLCLLSLILRLQSGIALSYDVSLIGSKEKLGEMQKLAFELLVEVFHRAEGYESIMDFLDDLVRMTHSLY